MTNMKRPLLHHPLSFQVMMEWYPLYEQVAKIEGVGELGADIGNGNNGGANANRNVVFRMLNSVSRLVCRNVPRNGADNALIGS